MPYEITASGVGAWQQGEIVEDADWEKYPHREKAIRKGYAVKAERAGRGLSTADQQAQAAELAAQIAQLQAQRDALLGLNQEANAPARVSVDIDANDQPGRAEADATRREGREVIQPLPGEAAIGAVVPGEAATAGSNAAPTADKPAEGKRSERK